MRREAIGASSDRGEEKFLLDLKSKILSPVSPAALANNSIYHHQHHGSQWK